MNNTIRNKLTTGVFWSFAEQFGRRGITVVVTVLLAHYIAPHNFGLISVLAVVIAFANVFMDAGIKEAIIRLREPSLLDLDTAFYANLIFSVIACFIILMSAPYISEFYSEPRLKILIEVASLSIIANAMQAVPSAVLARKLDFKRQFKVN
ncbi:capsular polysaccharide repeat unit transporter, partial [mine drainage metagenome]